MNSADIEKIVKQVIGEMQGVESLSKPSSTSVPKTARAAMLTSLEHYEIKEFFLWSVLGCSIFCSVYSRECGSRYSRHHY